MVIWTIVQMALPCSHPFSHCNHLPCNINNVLVLTSGKHNSWHVAIALLWSLGSAVSLKNVSNSCVVGLTAWTMAMFIPFLIFMPCYCSNNSQRKHQGQLHIKPPLNQVLRANLGYLMNLIGLVCHRNGICRSIRTANFWSWIWSLIINQKRFMPRLVSCQKWITGMQTVTNDQFYVCTLDRVNVKVSTW